MYKEQLEKMLAKVLNDEISTSIVYKAMSEYATNSKIAEELIDHSKDEFEHFNEIISFCINHGLDPVIELTEYTNDYPDTDKEILDFTQNLEQTAINDYRSIVLLARSNDDVETEAFFTEIMNDEIEHFDDLAPLAKETRSIQDNSPKTFSDYVKN
jgi:ferritin